MTVVYLRSHFAFKNDTPYLALTGELWDVFHEILHYNGGIMSAMASQITRLTIVYSAVYSGADQRKHQSSASLAFVRGIHRGPVNSPHKWPVTRKMFPFDDVIMNEKLQRYIYQSALYTATLPLHVIIVPMATCGLKCSLFCMDTFAVAANLSETYIHNEPEYHWKLIQLQTLTII